MSEVRGQKGKSKRQRSAPQRNSLRPGEIGSAFHLVNISQGKDSTGQGLRPGEIALRDFTPKE